MKWINAKEELPPRSEKIDFTSIDVLVCIFQYGLPNNANWGHGHYDFDEEEWDYTIIGRTDVSDNDVLFWAFPPKLPKLKCKHPTFHKVRYDLWRCDTCKVQMTKVKMESL